MFWHGMRVIGLPPNAFERIRLMKHENERIRWTGGAI